MAIVMKMHWPGVTPENYAQLGEIVRWREDIPPGARLHVAYFDDGINVLDVWDSQADFDNFLQNRLLPGVQKVGIQGQPTVSFADAHAIFAPNP